MSKRVLIVDDSESIREVISGCLTEAGYETLQGVNGEDGFVQLMNCPGVELVITDLNMPQLDGISFLKKIRNEAQFRFLPVIILTTESQESKRNEARQAGATAWIVKPFSREKIVSVIKKVLR